MTAVRTTRRTNATGIGPTEKFTASWKPWVMKPPWVGRSSRASPPRAMYIASVAAIGVNFA